MHDDSKVFGYRCPACKTVNSKSTTHCTNCGQWLLDTKYPAEPLKEKEYLAQVRAYAKSNRLSGKATGGGVWIKIIIGVAVVFFALMFIGALLGTPNQVVVPTSGNQSEPPKTTPKLKLLEAEIQEEGFLRSVVGIVKNNTRRQYKYVQIEINLYDSAGTQVGSTMTNVNNLEPDGQWKFKALFAEKDAIRFDVKSLNGY